MDVRMRRMIHLGVLQEPDSELSETECGGGVGHVQLNCNVAGLAAENFLPHLQDSQIIAPAPGGAKPQAKNKPTPSFAPARGVLRPGDAIGLAQGVAIEQISRIEPAGGEQKLLSVFAVTGGEHLAGALELTAGHLALLGCGRTRVLADDEAMRGISLGHHDHRLPGRQWGRSGLGSEWRRLDRRLGKLAQQLRRRLIAVGRILGQHPPAHGHQVRGNIGMEAAQIGRLCLGMPKNPLRQSAF